MRYMHCTEDEANAITRHLAATRIPPSALQMIVVVGFLSMGTIPLLGSDMAGVAFALVMCTACLAGAGGIGAYLLLLPYDATPHLDVIRRIRRDLERSGELDGRHGFVWDRALASAEQRILDGQRNEARGGRTLEEAVLRNPRTFILEGATSMYDYLHHPRTLEAAANASHDTHAHDKARELARRARDGSLPDDLMLLVQHAPQRALVDPRVTMFRQIRDARAPCMR